MKLVDALGKEVVFCKGMGIRRYFSEPGLVRITPIAGDRGELTSVYFGRDDQRRDNKRVLNVVHLEEVAFLIAHIIGMDVVKDTSINPSVGEGYRFV